MRKVENEHNEAAEREGPDPFAQNGHGRHVPPQNGAKPASTRSAALTNQVAARASDVAQKIGHTIDYMKQHLDEPVRAATLAAVANMSLPHYFALFKRSIGGTPIDFFIKLRMEHARRLLAETSWSVKEVAATLGYEDPLYFSRVFTSVNSAPPSHYRLSHNGTNGNGTKAAVLPRRATNGDKVAAPQPKMKDGRQNVENGIVRRVAQAAYSFGRKTAG